MPAEGEVVPEPGGPGALKKGAGEAGEACGGKGVEPVAIAGGPGAWVGSTGAGKAGVMIGENELHLCPAEVNRAIEQYLKSRWVDHEFTVSKVSEEVIDHGSQFVVRLSGKEQQ